MKLDGLLMFMTRCYVFCTSVIKQQMTKWNLPALCRIKCKQLVISALPNINLKLMANLQGIDKVDAQKAKAPTIIIQKLSCGFLQNPQT